jgi:hypothetical protein
MLKLLAAIIILFPAACLAQSPKLPPTPAAGSLSLMSLFPGPSTYPLAAGLCGTDGWSWGSRASNPTFPDTSLAPGCISQFRYLTCCRFSITLDTDKTPVWFHENHPDWVMYGPPQALQGTMTPGASAITGVTYNTSFPIGNYTLISPYGFSTRPAISSISSDGTTITMAQNSDCASLSPSQCGTNEYHLAIAGYATLRLTGDVTDGSPNITNVKLTYNGQQGSNGVTGAQGTYILDNSSCIAGGTSVTTFTTSYPQTYNISTTIKGGCPGGVQKFTALTESNYSTLESAYGNCTSSCQYTPLNIADPNVQEFLLSGCTTSGGADCTIPSPVKNGYAGIALDNISSFNGFSNIYGTFYGATAPCAVADQPACGGTLVQQYTVNTFWGSATYGDPVFQKDRIQWAQKVRGAVNATGGLLFVNLGGSPSGAAALRMTDIAAQAAIANNSDGMLVEHGGSSGCNAGQPKFYAADNWKNMFATIQLIETGVSVSDGSYCGSSVSVSGTAEQQYDVATYLLLGKVGCANGGINNLCFWFNAQSPSDGVNLNNGILPPYNAAWFPACGDVAQAGPAGIGTVTPTDTSYQRRYPRCIVGLNPDDKNTATLTLPAGNTYTDLYGTPVSPGVVTLNPTVPGATGNALVAIIQ